MRLTTYRFNAAVLRARDLIPRTLWERVPLRLWTEPPGFTGLHRYADTTDGRPYSGTAHVAYPWHITGPASRRVPTLVALGGLTPAEVVHEWGHLLDWRLGFGWDAEPVTAYATTSDLEAFAEAFTAWVGCYGPEVRPDERMAALFDGLAA